MMAPAMSQQPVTFQQVIVSEAAGILGVSTQTVRRMLRRGQLEGERVHRAQGSAYVVRLPAPVVAGDTDATPTQQPSPHVSRSNATDQPAPAEAMVSLIQTTIGTVLGPLVGELAASRQTIERQADQLVSQAETIGELTAENRALAARTAPQDAETQRPVPDSLAHGSAVAAHRAGDRRGGGAAGVAAVNR
jgi:excisionase family DNA binding protein